MGIRLSAASPLGSSIETGEITNGTILAEDLSTTLTNDLVHISGTETITGAKTFSSVILGPSGAVGAPAFSFSGDTNTGFYNPSADTVILGLGGVLKYTFEADKLTSVGTYWGPDGSASLPGFAFTNDSDCGLYRIGTNNIGLAVNAAKVLDINTTGLAVTGKLGIGAAAGSYGINLLASDSETALFKSASASNLNFYLQPGSASGGNTYLKMLNASGTEKATLSQESGQAILNGVDGLVLRSNSSAALSFNTSQVGTFSGVALGPNGSASAPTWSFTNDPDCGMYRTGTNGIAFATAGAGAVWVSADANVGIGAAPYSGYHLDIQRTSPILALRGAGSGNNATVYVEGGASGGSSIISFATGGGTATGSITVSSAGSSTFNMARAAAQYLDIQLNNTSHLYINDSGVKFQGKPIWSQNSTGAGTPLLGTNCPASTLTAPYTWLQCVSSDGSTVYVPAWK